MQQCGGAAISLCEYLTLLERDLQLFLAIFPLALCNQSLIAPVPVLVIKEDLLQEAVEKWIKENDSKLSTSVWLKFNMADRKHLLC